MEGINKSRVGKPPHLVEVTLEITETGVTGKVPLNAGMYNITNREIAAGLRRVDDTIHPENGIKVIRYIKEK